MDLCETSRIYEISEYLSTEVHRNAALQNQWSLSELTNSFVHVHAELEMDSHCIFVTVTVTISAKRK